MAGSLAEQLSAAVAAVELGGDNFKELVATGTGSNEEHRGEQKEAKKLTDDC